jgi:hypothetical protein
MAGFDGHAADGVGGHGGELAELAVFEPEDAVGDRLAVATAADITLSPNGAGVRSPWPAA